MEELLDQLRRLDRRDRFPAEAAALMADWERRGIGNKEALAAVLQFMEEQPDLDFGSPGPLVHFVERFCGQDYNETLAVSLERKPTPHKVWMLNRMLNALGDHSERARYLGTLRNIATSPTVDELCRERARHFLRVQGG